jgi:predicted ester cyclase
MKQTQQNKEFIIGYFNALSDSVKTRELLSKFMTDEALIEHILFFESVFPKYNVIADELTAEGNRVVVRCRMTGKHEGVLNGIPPTYKSVEFPFAIGYEIENNKIIDHWLIADQMMLMEQLGLMKAAEQSA